MNVQITQKAPTPVGRWGSSNETRFDVRHENDNDLMGELAVSAGGVAWRTKRAQYFSWVSWEELADLLTKRGQSFKSD